MTVGVMSITPFTPAGEVDSAMLTSHLRRIGRHDVSVYLCSQGSGEGLALSLDDKAEVCRTAVKTLGGRRSLVGAGVGLAGDTVTAVRQAEVLGATGVDAIQVLPPRTGALRPTDQELGRYFDEVLEAAPCPVVVAENVALVGYEIGPAVLHRVVDRPEVIGLSYTVPSAGPVQLTEVLTQWRDRVEVRVGVLHHITTVAALGGAGVLCFDGNLAPGLIARAWAVAVSSDRDLRLVLRTLFELNAILTRYRNPGSIKAALEQFGLPAGALRRPLLGLGGPERAALGEELDRIAGLDAWF